MYERDPKAIIWLALMHAIDERLSFADAWNSVEDNEPRERALSQARDFQRMLKRRYGMEYPPLPDPNERKVSIYEMLTAPDSDFMPPDKALDGRE